MPRQASRPSDVPMELTPNQLVAFNLRRARLARGWTQEQAAERLLQAGGPRWSKALWSAAERSVDGIRIRQFDADLLVALTRAFDLSFMFFFSVPIGRTITLSEQTTAIPLSDFIQGLLGKLNDPEDDAVTSEVPDPLPRPDTRAARQRLEQWSTALRDLLDAIDSARRGADKETE